MAKQITFLMPEGEWEQLQKLRPRNPDNLARDIVRGSLYRMRQRDQRIAFKKKQRAERDRAMDQPHHGHGDAGS